MKHDNASTVGWVQKAMSNDKIRRWILIAGLVGIALIFLSGFFSSGGEKPAQETPQESAATGEYTQQLEESLLEIIRAITGEEDAQVMVTLESSSRQVYAQEERKSAGNSEEQASDSTVRSQSTDDTETSYILVEDSDGSQKALSVTEISPEIRGVVVVCGKGSDAELQQNIINAVTTALQISSTRVCVVGRG